MLRLESRVSLCLSAMVLDVPALLDGHAWCDVAFQRNLTDTLHRYEQETADA
jgi:hypothetical protein